MWIQLVDVHLHKILVVIMTQCEIGRVGLFDENILFVDIESGKEIGVEHVYEFKNVAKELANCQKLYSIINCGAYTLPTAKARELCAQSSSNDYILARAIVVQGLGQMILARHTIRRSKLKIPMRIFTDLKKAELWVRGIRSQSDKLLLNMNPVQEY